MLKWFSLSGIAKEIKRIRWPKTQDLFQNSVEVILFCIFFGIFFVFCEFVITVFLRWLGVIG